MTEKQTEASADALLRALEEIADPAAEASVARFYKGDASETTAMGVPFGQVFAVAKRFTDLPPADIERLLEDDRYEVRMAAVSVMDFRARRKKLPEADRKALFDLYLRRHDRIDNWDLVDRAAPHVVGEYLVDQDRSVLDRLAASSRPTERRTALVASHAFLKRGETADTFRIAEALAADEDTYVQKAIASWVREAGKRDPEALVAFLKSHRETLPRSTVTAASKFLSDEQKAEIRGA